MHYGKRLLSSAPADDSRDKLERGSDITCDFEKVTLVAAVFFLF
jgi:hypothetical protein